jgi:PQQ-like domain
MAGFEFETRLRLVLREAAEREAERGRAGRAVARSRSAWAVTRRSFVPAAAAVLATVLAVAVATVLLTRSGPEREAVQPPEVVARFTLGESPGGTLGAYGSFWVADKGPDRLLRIDPDSRRVTARFPFEEGDVAMAPAGGTLWALQNEGTGSGRGNLLLGIDPGSNDITARLRLRTPSGAPALGIDLAADQNGFWVLGQIESWYRDDSVGLIRLTPQDRRATVAFALPGGSGRVGIALRHDGLWAITADDRLLRYDARTGEKLSETRLDLPATGRDTEPAPGKLQFAGDTLVTSIPGGLAGIDPNTGRVVWRRQLGVTVHAWTEARGVIWAAVAQGPDRLVAIEPDDGRVATSVGLDTFSTAGITSVGDQLWVTTQGGEAIVLQR